MRVCLLNLLSFFYVLVAVVSLYNLRDLRVPNVSFKRRESDVI